MKAVKDAHVLPYWAFLRLLVAAAAADAAADDDEEDDEDDDDDDDNDNFNNNNNNNENDACYVDKSGILTAFPRAVVHLHCR